MYFPLETLMRREGEIAAKLSKENLFGEKWKYPVETIYNIFTYLCLFHLFCVSYATVKTR